MWGWWQQKPRQNQSINKKEMKSEQPCCMLNAMNSKKSPHLLQLLLHEISLTMENYVKENTK